jgi:hypothetical protein
VTTEHSPRSQVTSGVIFMCRRYLPMLRKIVSAVIIAIADVLRGCAGKTHTKP